MLDTKSIFSWRYTGTKKNQKKCRWCGSCSQKKDFGTYWPEKEEWTRQKIKPDSCYGRVIWGEEHPTWEREKKENILQSTEDLERIKKFCKANVYNEEHWWEYIYKHEDDIVTTARRNREHKAYMRRQNPVRKEKEVQEKRVESIREVDFSGLKVPFVAVYGHPDDFPDKYVARIYELDKATDTIMVKETLEEITADIKEHTAMTFIPRGTADVPSLVGVWM